MPADLDNKRRLGSFSLELKTRGNKFQRVSRDDEKTSKRAALLSIHQNNDMVLERDNYLPEEEKAETETSGKGSGHMLIFC